ncbi:MAG: chemotaxis protein CheW [Cyanobacteria bacterium J06650_10]
MQNNCWRDIGVWGDLSCPQLVDEIHCHNCSVYAQMGQALLKRTEPEGYTAEWTALIAQSHDTSQTQMGPDRQAVMVFRLGAEWVALPARIFHQVIAPSPVHAIPHRHDSLLRGIVNVRGQLLPCVSLHELLNIQASASKTMSFSGWTSTASTASTASAESMATLNSRQQGGYPRLVILKRLREIWAFEVDELYGFHFCPQAELRETPVLSSKALTSLTQSIFSWRAENVSCLDAEQLFSILRQRAL